MNHFSTQVLATHRIDELRAIADRERLAGNARAGRRTGGRGTRRAAGRPSPRALLAAFAAALHR